MTKPLDTDSVLNKLLKSKHTCSAVFFLSLLESTILFFPLEAVLIPLMQYNRDKLWRLAGAALLGCLAGAFIGYQLGAYVLAEFSQDIVSLFGSQADFDAAKQQLSEQGFLYIFLAGVTPIPFQVAMLMAGAVVYPIWLFMLATLLARSLRYFGLAVLVYYVGERASKLIKQHKKPVMIGLSFLAVGVIVFNHLL